MSAPRSPVQIAVLPERRRCRWMRASSSIAARIARRVCGRCPAIAASFARTATCPARPVRHPSIRNKRTSVADLIGRVPRRTGHFRFESGFHGDLWLELDALFADPAQTEHDANALAGGVADIRIDVVCGAMTGGALLAQVVARHLGCLFAYTEREYAGGRARYWLAD